MLNLEKILKAMVKIDVPHCCEKTNTNIVYVQDGEVLPVVCVDCEGKIDGGISTVTLQAYVPVMVGKTGCRDIYETLDSVLKWNREGRGPKNRHWCHPETVGRYYD